MKRLMTATLLLLVSGFGYQAFAQDEVIRVDKDGKTEEQIIIRKKGSKDKKMTVEIKDDKVFIDGKPLAEYKDDDISIRKKKIIVREGDNVFVDGYRGRSDHDAFIWNSEGAVERGFLGVVTAKDDAGARIIDDVSKESPAGKAGLEKGDIIYQVGDDKIDGPQSLMEAISSRKPKEEVKIRYKRNGKEKSMKVELGAKKRGITRSFTIDAPDGSYKSFTMPALPPMPPMPPMEFNLDGQEFHMDHDFGEGLRDLELSARNLGRRQKLGLKIQDTEEGNGVKVLEVSDSSAAAAAGLKKDDVITEIGGTKPDVNYTKTVRKALMQ